VASITEEFLRPLTSAAARPLITHYDDAAGTRVELSVATVYNWAAKTANWLTEELDVEPGTEVAVLLPAHWQTAAVLLGAWWCGANITGDPAGAAVAFVPPGGAAPGAGAVAAASLDPMGRDLGGSAPGGALDYVGDARVHGDDFRTFAPIPGDTPALLGSTVDDVVALSRQRAETLGLGGRRVLSTMEWTLPDGVVDGLLAVLAAGAGLVQVSNPDPAKLASRKETERTTVDLS
jgi:uncharacterized protein (TIGR03089 family)